MEDLLETEDDPSIDVGDNETIVLSRVRRHWVVLAWMMSAPVLVVLLTGAVGWMSGGMLAGVTWAGLIVAAAMAVIVWLRWYLEWLTLTSQRVVLEAGVIVRSIKVIPLDHIQDIETRQSILGRLLGYGTIEIDAVGREGVEQVQGAPRPNLLRERVFEQQRVLAEEHDRAGDGFTSLPARHR